MITNSHSGQDLRDARKRVGLTRARLAGLAECSIASLDRIEQGAVPRRSAVLERAWRVVNDLAEGHGPPATSSLQRDEEWFNGATFDQVVTAIRAGELDHLMRQAT